MKIYRFEEMETWQQARILARLVYDRIGIQKIQAKDVRLIGQLQGAAVSVMANIAEGFSRRSNKEFIQFLFISKGSVAEVQSHLYVALDQNYIKEDEFKEIYQQAEKVAKLISGLIKYLSKSLKKTSSTLEPNK